MVKVGQLCQAGQEFFCEVGSLGMKQPLPRLLLVALVVTGCARACGPTNEDLQRHAVRDVAFWGDRLERPLADRIEAAPPEVVEYLSMDNEVNGFAARAAPAEL